MRRPALSSAFALAILVTLLSTPVGAAGQATASASGTRPAFDTLAWRRLHGYLPLRGVAALERAKAHAAAEVAALHGQPAAPVGAAGAPKIGASWQGNYGATPPDANGAIGPKSYIETVNLSVGIYKRDGSLIVQASFFSLTGHTNQSDPMVIWDPDTQRFYYSIIDVGNATMDWGFTKDDNPTSIPGSFCNYETAFGYPSNSIPDYPKLGQSRKFLMMGINFYPAGSQAATEADLLWIGKPQGKAPISTCPAAGSFQSGKFTDLRNQDASQAFTPVPAIQTDPSGSGYVVAMSDIECPPICGKGTLLTSYTLKPSRNNPKVPQLSAPVSITVGKYQSPPDAPQKGTSNLLDTLDGRLTHAVSGFDPKVGTTTVWVSHCVLGGAGSVERWYEIIPGKNASLVKSGAAKDSTLYVFNGAVSPDRTVDAAGNTAHGKTMVMGFNTSSSSTYVAVQMVSKSGSNAQSAFVLVLQSMAPFSNPGCGPLGCRWGDYAGATPDPAADLAARNGEVWLTSEYTLSNGSRPSWNWEAIP